MKTQFARLLSLALFVMVAGSAASYGQIDVRVSMGSPGNQVSVSYFYDNLAPYGEWFQDASYGWVWTPYDVSADWRPYSDGHWQYTDYGWSWASNEAWGWAPYHYGRWLFDDSYGWVWVPGTEWAPAWVAWRQSGGWIGWAPLPPTARWDRSRGLDFNDPDAIPSYEWCFVPQRHLLDTRLRVQVVILARNVTLLGLSRDATRFDVRDGRAFNAGPDVAQFEINIGRRVPRVRIIDVDTPGRGRGQSAGHGNVGFFRPMVRPGPSEQASPPSVTQGRNPIPENILQRQRVQQQRKLESDIRSEQTRLARDQKNELRTQTQGPAIDRIRKQHAAEQQALHAHADRQRRVLDQRIQKQIVKPGKTKSVAVKSDKSQGPGKRGR
jgi:hypothetical protein